MIQLKKRSVDISLSIILAAVIIFGYKNEVTKKEEAPSEEIEKVSAGNFYGYSLDSFYVENRKIVKNDIFGNILSSIGLNANTIMLLEHESKNVFNMRSIKVGADYHIIKKDECSEIPIALIYQPDVYSYIVYDLSGAEPKVEKKEKEVTLCEEYVEGKIEGSLWKALEKEGVSPAIIDQMEEALSSSVDFYHAKKGDEFKLLFEKKYIDGEMVGLGRLIVANYINNGGSHYSLLFEGEKGEGYFDTEGRSAKKSFLQAPVKFSRISSNYNLRRFHPVKKQVIAHLGTDYAAPYGTPIHSVADGVIEAASYTKNNGYFVKVKHDNIYQTQYLHMSRFAKGIKPGVRVKQGQTIGYVGATGLATGPHVCYRFWKNGKQVNHLKEKLPSTKKMDANDLPKFFEYKDQMLDKIENLSQFYKATRNNTSGEYSQMVP